MEPGYVDSQIGTSFQIVPEYQEDSDISSFFCYNACVALLLDLVITHGISNDRQALFHGAGQIWGRSTIVPVGLNVVSPLWAE